METENTTPEVITEMPVEKPKPDCECSIGNPCHECDDCSTCLSRLEWNAKIKDLVYDPRKLQIDIHCATKYVDLTPVVTNTKLWELKDVDDSVKCATTCDMLRFDGSNWIAKKPDETPSLWHVAGFTEGGCLVKLPHPSDLPTKYLKTNPDGSTSLEEIKQATGDINWNKIVVVDGDGNLAYTDLSPIINRIKAIEDAIYNWNNDKTTPIVRGNMIFRYSVNDGVSYPYFLQGAAETAENVVRGRVKPDGATSAAASQ